MRIITAVEPAIEPVTLAQAKLHARIDIDDDDSLINLYIMSARRYCEEFCSISFITQTKTVFYDYSELAYINYILLPVGPVQSVESVDVYDNNNAYTLVDPSAYYLAGNNMALVQNYSWPPNLREFDAYKMDVVAGFGDNAEDVPAEIREAILRLVAHTYDNREALYGRMTRGINDPTGGVASYNVPHSVTACLQPYKEYYL